MITGKRKEALVAELTTENHTLLSDVAEKIGGQDKGLDPHELLEAALTACTIITAQMYANRKGIKLESTDVVVKILSEGAETKIQLDVSFRGDLSPAERTRLSEIIERCPIHRLLVSKVSIDTIVHENQTA